MNIIEMARSLLAVIQPAVGARASGVATVASTAGTVLVPRAAYAVPRIAGVLRHDLLLKVAAGPDAGEAWEVTPAGDSVALVSNLGGEACNQIPAGAELVFDPPVAGVATAVVQIPGFTGGAWAGSYGSLMNAVLFESFGGPARNLDLFRSGVGGVFPAAVLTWSDSELADGAATSMSERATRVGTRSVLYRENFTLWVVSSRKDGDQQRRSEGLAVLGNLTALLTDRQAVDGEPFSNPSGVQIRRRYREPGNGQGVFQDYYVYAIDLSCEHAVVQSDSRTFNPWLQTRLDMHPIDNTPPEPIVENNLIDMTP